MPIAETYDERLAGLIDRRNPSPPRWVPRRNRSATGTNTQSNDMRLVLGVDRHGKPVLYEFTKADLAFLPDSSSVVGSKRSGSNISDPNNFAT